MALWFTVVGAKLIVIDRYGSDVPEWDQWDAEGLAVLQPWKQGNLTLQDLVRPHNEHRILPTKLLGLGGVAANGQWDARLQCVINAGLHGLIAAGLLLAGMNLMRPRWYGLWFALLAATFMLPLAWQNVLAGFHSQQYFLLGFTLAALWLLPGAQAWTGRWWMGFGATLMASLSMGSGFLVAAVIFALIALEVLQARSSWIRHWPTLAFCGVFVAVGWLTRVEVSYHAALKAQNATDLITSALRSLRWPSAGSYGWAALFWAPWIFLVLRHLHRDPGFESSDARRLIGLGGWVVLQIAAAAYARGAGGEEPASRYIDTLVVGLVSNGLILAWLLSTEERSRRWRPCLAIVAVAWIIAAGAGIHRAARQSIVDDLEGWVAGYHHEGDLRVRAYLATNDRSYLATGSIPYPGSDSLRERLDQKELRELLPASVRPSLETSPMQIQGFRSVDARRLPFPPPEQVRVSPETPVLVGKLAWTSHGTTKGEHLWVSSTLDPELQGRLLLWATGTPSGIDQSIEMIDAERPDDIIDRYDLSDLQPSSWSMISRPMPNRAFKLRIRQNAPANWFAFSEPVVTGELSYLAARAAQAGRFFVIGGIALAAVAAAGTWTAHRQARRNATPA